MLIYKNSIVCLFASYQYCNVWGEKAKQREIYENAPKPLFKYAHIIYTDLYIESHRNIQNNNSKPKTHENTKVLFRE